MQRKKKVTKTKRLPITANLTGDYFTDVTIETIEKLRKGTIKPVEANAISRQAAFILQRAKIQLEIMKFTGSKDKAAASKLLTQGEAP